MTIFHLEMRGKKKTQEGTNYDCMLNKPKLLSFTAVEEIHEAELLAQIGEDSPEQISPV